MEINGALITVKREIENTQRRPMSIFIGEFEKATASNYEGWHIYPYSKSDKTESLSQLLFKALDFPEISTENQESITINQILRLLYVDQLSSLDSLMRNEDFDSPLIRSAIGNLLLGTYNDDLLKIQIELRKKEREYNDVKKQVKAIEDVFDNSPFEFDNNSIQSSINDRKSQLEKVLRALIEPETISASVKKNDTKNEINKLRNELLKYKDRYDITLNEISKAKAGILDNNEFIDVLNGKLTAIKIPLPNTNLPLLLKINIQYILNPECQQPLLLSFFYSKL